MFQTGQNRRTGDGSVVRRDGIGQGDGSVVRRDGIRQESDRGTVLLSGGTESDKNQTGGRFFCPAARRDL